jgi:TnpA family transposase
MCPRLKALKDRHLFLPRGCEVPEILKPICEASLDLSQVPTHWDPWVHLLASVYSGHTSAVSVMARFGSAARGDPLYEVGVVIGRLLRTCSWPTTSSIRYSGASCYASSIAAKRPTP